MTTATREAMHERIRRHGADLLRIFPNATERDPVKLCKRLRRLEREGEALALRMCNGPEFARESEQWEIKERILSRVQAILGYSTIKGFGAYVTVFLNTDPRGYALKIDNEWLDEHRGNPDTVQLTSIHRDWGGYGIIAPDLSQD